MNVEREWWLASDGKDVTERNQNQTGDLELQFCPHCPATHWPCEDGTKCLDLWKDLQIIFFYPGDIVETE